MDTGRLVGETIDQFYIKSHIARGGMADVYLAIDTILEREVAFKVMLDALALDPRYVERFQREAKVVARLDHPNIVQVYSTGQTPLGQPYIAMQYISGGSLRDKLKQLADKGKLLTAEQTLNIARQLAVALSVAHQADVIHRDLKPGNVLIRSDGTPVLVDLGIAAVAKGKKLTSTGGFVGTPAYMSPEQARSKPLDGRSDIYSFGIILYELLAGRRPFEGEDMTAVLYKHVYEEPPSLKEIRPDLAPQTISIVDNCLKKDPDTRFQRAEAIIPAIDAALLAEANAAPNPHATEVLTYLPDNELISRRRLLQLDAAETPLPVRRGRPPIWAIVTAVFAFLVVCFLTGWLFFARLVPFVVENRTVPTINPTQVVENETVEAPSAATKPPAVEPTLPATDTLMPTLSQTEPPPAPTPTEPAATVFEFTVSAGLARNETGLQVQAGRQILVEFISGGWRAGPPPTWPIVGPEGDPQVASKNTFPVQDAPIVSLIGGVGSADPILIGPERRFYAPADGVLWLGGNDDDFSDNEGSIIVRITVQPLNSFQPLPLGTAANSPVDLTTPPTGNVTLGGIPFELSETIFKSQASTGEFTQAPVSLSLPADIEQARHLHLLINLGNGFTQFANQVVGRVEVVCNGSPFVVSELQAGVHLREWHNRSEQIIRTAPMAQLVWQEQTVDGLQAVIDLLTLDLPEECQYGRLTQIELIDASVENVGSLDPALNLIGVTVEYRP